MIDTATPVAFAKDFLSILDLTPVDLDRLLTIAAQMKADRRVGRSLAAAVDEFLQQVDGQVVDGVPAHVLQRVEDGGLTRAGHARHQ